MTVAREQALLLGPRRSLVGILTEPPPELAGDRPLVVLLNSGIVHRVGANRMSVVLARALAAAGHLALRVDISGLGDSLPRTDALTPLDAALADIREVLDTLERARGTRRFVLGGLCSGADESVVYAASDPRVVGAILLDPTLPSTPLSRLHHYRKRLLHGESWLNVLRGKNPLWRTLVGRRPPAPHPPTPRQPDVNDPEVRAYLEGVYAASIAAGVRLLAISTGERATYRRQLVDAFPDVPFGDRLQLEYLGHSDHTFALQADRARVVAVAVAWARAGFPEGRSQARASAASGVRG